MKKNPTLKEVLLDLSQRAAAANPLRRLTSHLQGVVEVGKQSLFGGELSDLGRQIQRARSGLDFAQLKQRIAAAGRIRRRKA